MASEVLSPYSQFFDEDGDPLDSGYLYFGQESMNPETAPVVVYWDAGLTQPAAQPVRTLNGYPLRAGTPATLYVDDLYSISVKDRRGRLLYYRPSLGGSYRYPALAARSRSISSRLADSLHVQDFGARGDGVTDDTAAIQAADTFARAQNPPRRVVFGNGTFMVSQLVVYTDSNWEGNGKDVTVIKQIIGSNKDVIYGVNSAANWGNNAPTNAPNDFSLKGLTIDGNWNGGAGNTSGSGIAIMGDHYIMQDVYVKNCAEHGIRTEFVGDAAGNYASAFLESSFSHIAVDYVGKHGWWFKGPHDSIRLDVRILDAGQLGDNLWDGFYNEASSSRDVTIHAATRSGRFRMRYAVSLQNGAAHEFSGGCNIEGAYSANLGLFSSGCTFDPSTRFYAAWNGVNILLGGTNCSLNLIRGLLQGPPAGRPACFGIVFSSTVGHVINDNDIDVTMAAQDAGAVQFSAQDAGGNRIRAKVFTTANVGVSGTPNPSNELLIRGKINGSSPYELNNLEQTTYLAAVPAGGSFVWNFPRPFRTSPNVQATIGIPSVAPTAPIWVSTVSTTSATIFNPNANAMPVFVSAKGVY